MKDSIRRPAARQSTRPTTFSPKRGSWKRSEGWINPMYKSSVKNIYVPAEFQTIHMPS